MGHWVSKTSNCKNITLYWQDKNGMNAWTGTWWDNPGSAGCRAEFYGTAAGHKWFHTWLPQHSFDGVGKKRSAGRWCNKCWCHMCCKLLHRERWTFPRDWCGKAETDCLKLWPTTSLPFFSEMTLHSGWHRHHRQPQEKLIWEFLPAFYPAASCLSPMTVLWHSGRDRQFGGCSHPVSHSAVLLVLPLTQHMLYL